MSDPRSLQPAVDRLITRARSFHDLFLLNYRDETNRQKLRTGWDGDGVVVRETLHSLWSKTVLKSALNTPNSNYNQFISAWNNGTGVLLSSFNRLTEFWSSLQTAQPELNRLMAPQPGPGPQPTSGPRGTPAEVAVFTSLRSQTNDLYQVFESCVQRHTPESRLKITEHVKVIRELLNNSSLGHDAQTLLTNSKEEWLRFFSLYKHGAGVDPPAGWESLKQLVNFQTVANIACIRFLGH